MTTNEKWSVPDTTVTVPTSVSPDGLTSLVKGLLTEADTDFDVEEVGFDFIVFDQLIRTTLGDVIQAKEDVSASEAVVEVTYVERYINICGVNEEVVVKGLLIFATNSKIARLDLV